MKKRTKEKIKMKTSVDYVIAVILILAITAIIYIGSMIFTQREISLAASSHTKELVNQPTSNENDENQDIIVIPLNDNQTENEEELNYREVIETKEVDIEYTTQYIETLELPKGTLQVQEEGIDGRKTITMKQTYEGEKLIKEEKIEEKVIKVSTNKIVSIGIGKYSNSYKAKVGDTLYATPIILAIRIEPNEKAEKLITLNQDTAVTLLKKKEEWYQVQYQTYIGWVKSDCLTYSNPQSNDEVEDTRNNQYTKQQLLNKLSFDMKLNQPSGLSLEQFKKIFANDSKDSKKIFANNAQYFYYAEKQYNINGVFLAAVAIHESGWGGSAISSDKNNLFGYGAYDSNAYQGAYEFSNYAEGIDLLARVFSKYYLNPKGTKIYDGNVADGCYYHGANLSGVNVKYATDKNWSNGVYSWMKYLYNRL